MKSAVLALGLGIVFCAPPREPIPRGARVAMEAVTPDEIRADMAFLADDLLEGRQTGTSGYALAALYVKSRLEGLGLEPAGEDGSFFQHVPLRQAWLQPNESSLVVLRDGVPQPLRYGDDFLLDPPLASTESRVRAGLVFAGYGIQAPELDHDDYAGVDVSGKVVLHLAGAPTRFGSTARAVYSSRETKAEQAIAAGALGLVQIQSGEGRWSWDALRARAAGPATSWVDPDSGELGRASAGLQISGYLNESVAEELLSSADRSLASVLLSAESGDAPRFDLPVSVVGHATARHVSLETPNVIARVDGAELPRESVVFSAHLDHVGRGRPVDGDDLYNGAYDNASGVAVLLAVARAFAATSPKPGRSIVFLAAAAEESGLLGSDYFARHPTVPPDGIVANVNADGVLMFHPLRDVVAFGADHSTIREPMEQAGRHLGVALSPDFMPEEVIFVRSDQYSFVRRGIPAVYPFVGIDSGDPQKDGEALLREWMSERYHKPSDDMGQDIDFEAGARYARLVYLTSLFIANGDERPRWNEGDFIGERFGSK